MDRHQPVPQPPAVQRTSELAAHHTHVSISLVAGCTRELASAHIPSDWHPTREEWPAVTKPRPTNRARKRPQQYGKPAPGIALEDAALARVASRAPRCGLRAACVPTRASQSRSVQAPPYHHLDRRSSPPDNDAAAKAFSGLLVTPRTPSGLVLSLSLLLVYFHVWVWPSLCPATWLAHHRKNKTENKNLMVFTEEDWIRRQGAEAREFAGVRGDGCAGECRVDGASAAGRQHISGVYIDRQPPRLCRGARRPPAKNCCCPLAPLCCRGFARGAKGAARAY